MKHRWPKSIHSQIEAVFHGIRSIGASKLDNEKGVRSFGVWKVYRNEAHRLADYFLSRGCTNILDTTLVHSLISDYLTAKLGFLVVHRRSRQTYETILAAISKFEYELNSYIQRHNLLIPPLTTEDVRKCLAKLAKTQLKKSSRLFFNRAYPDPVALIQAITKGTYQLQACLQYEGGLRAEGVGAPSHRRMKNPLTMPALRNIGIDPVTGEQVGIVASTEKGGKETEHYISVETCRRLHSHISTIGALESDYVGYVEAINQAARDSNQHAAGRGSHGLKHNFAQERYQQCIEHGFTHEMALQQTSLETSHFRMRETLTYTRG